MKILKIAGIFILVIALFGGIIYFLGVKPEGSLPPEEVKHYREKIDEKWRGVVWDESVFEYVKGYLGRHRSELRGSYNSLIDYNSETAISHINESLMDEFHKSDCSTAKVEEYYAGVLYLLTNDADHTATDSRISKLKSTYKLYKDVEKFCERNFRVTNQSFDLESTEFWSPLFSEHRNSVMSTMNSLKRNSCYPEIRNITRFQNGFNSVSSKLDAAELAYMKTIYNLIVEANVTNSDKQINILKQFRNDFETIISHNSEASNMARNLSLRYN